MVSGLMCGKLARPNLLWAFIATERMEYKAKMPRYYISDCDPMSCYRSLKYINK